MKAVVSIELDNNGQQFLLFALHGSFDQPIRRTLDPELHEANDALGQETLARVVLDATDIALSSSEEQVRNLVHLYYSLSQLCRPHSVKFEYVDPQRPRAEAVRSSARLAL